MIGGEEVRSARFSGMGIQIRGGDGTGQGGSLWLYYRDRRQETTPINDALKLLFMEPNVRHDLFINQNLKNLF